MIPFQNARPLILFQDPTAHPNNANSSPTTYPGRQWEWLEQIPHEYDEAMHQPVAAWASGRPNGRIFWPSDAHQRIFPGPGQLSRMVGKTGRYPKERTFDIISDSYAGYFSPTLIEGGYYVSGLSRLLADHALNADIYHGSMVQTGIVNDPWKPWVAIPGTYGRTGVNPFRAITTVGFGQGSRTFPQGLGHSSMDRGGTKVAHVSGGANPVTGLSAVQIHGKDSLVGRPAFSPLVKGHPVAWLPGSRKDQGFAIGIAGWTNLLISDWSSRVTTRQEAIFTTRVADMSTRDATSHEPEFVAPLSTLTQVIPQLRDEQDLLLTSNGQEPKSCAWVGGITPVSAYAGRGQMTSHGWFADQSSILRKLGQSARYTPGGLQRPNAVIYASETGGGPLSSGAGGADQHVAGRSFDGTPHVQGHVDGRSPVFYSRTFDCPDKHDGFFQQPLAQIGFPVEVFKRTDPDEFHLGVGAKFSPTLHFGLHKWQTYVPIFIPPPIPDPPPFPPETGGSVAKSQAAFLGPVSEVTSAVETPALVVEEIDAKIANIEELPLESSLVVPAPPAEVDPRAARDRDAAFARASAVATEVVTPLEVSNVQRLEHHWLPQVLGAIITRPEPVEGPHKDAPYSNQPHTDFFKTPLGAGFFPFGEQKSGGEFVETVLGGRGYRVGLPLQNSGMVFGPAHYSLDPRVTDPAECPRFLFVIHNPASGNCAGKGRLGFGLAAQTGANAGKIYSGWSVRHQQDVFGFEALIFAKHDASAVETDVFRVNPAGDIRLGAAGASVLLTRAGASSNIQLNVNKSGTVAVMTDLPEGVLDWIEVDGAAGSTNLAVNQGVLADHTSAGEEYVLPEIGVDAASGDVCMVKDRKDTFGTNSAVITCSGSDTIEEGGPTSETLNTSGYVCRKYRATRGATNNYWVRI